MSRSSPVERARDLEQAGEPCERDAVGVGTGTASGTPSPQASAAGRGTEGGGRIAEDRPAAWLAFGGRSALPDGRTHAPSSRPASPAVSCRARSASGSTRGACATRLRGLGRVQLVGEAVNCRRRGRACSSELRDAQGRCPARCGARTSRRSGCPKAPWPTARRSSWRAAATSIPARGPASPHFSFAVADLRRRRRGRPAGPGRAAAPAAGGGGPVRAAEGAGSPAAAAHDRVVTGEGGKAGDDVLAGLRRRGWGGRLVWAHAPVQDRQRRPADHPRRAGARRPGGGRARRSSRAAAARRPTSCASATRRCAGRWRSCASRSSRRSATTPTGR
jgi:hypothetical protein